MIGQLREEHEAGAILPLTAFLLVVLLMFAAFAVDLGAAWAERREAQTAVDAGVMAAALQYLVATPDEDTTFDLVSTYVNLNNTGVPPFTFDDWDTCVDPDRPGDYAPLGDSGTWDSPLNGLSLDEIDCISVKQAGLEPAVLRVRLPYESMPTAFARVIGMDTMDITAAAEAEIRISEASDILPFSLPANPAAEECLGTPPSGQLPPDVAPCAGPASGNFGMLNVWWFGADDAVHDTLGSGCPSKPPFGTRAPYNLAIGVDHPITTWPDTDGDEDTYDGPPIGTNQPNNHPGAESCDLAGNDVIPYVIQTNTGNTVSELEDGFFDGPSFGTANAVGRLRQPSPIPATISEDDARITFTENSGSYTVDNLGMWEYLDQTKIDVMSPCSTNTFNGPSANVVGQELAGRELTDQMELCLASGDAIFTDDILDSPRFAVVPQLNYFDGAQAGTQWWAVMDMVAVYLQTTWYQCKSPTADCLFEPTGHFEAEVAAGDPAPDGKSVFFGPGEGSTPPCLPKNSACNTPGSVDAMGVSAFVVESDWLSEAAKNSLGKPQPYEVYLRK